MIDGETKILGVIGNPITHTLSPLLQNAMLEEIGENAVYVPFEITELEDVVRGILGLRLGGINVTVPYKTQILPYMDSVSEEASAVGAVNTVVNRNGKLYGYNTDIRGIYDAMCADGIEVRGKNVMVLGGGGAAAGVSYSAAKYGAARVDVLNRTHSKAAALSDMIKGFNTESVPYRADGIDYDVVVNTTSAGMAPNADISPISDYSIFAKGACLVDIIYKPKVTLLMKNAAGAGARQTVNGLNMLIFQGIYALELFLDRRLDRDRMHKVICDKLKGAGIA